MNLTDFAIGDVLEFVQRSNCGEERRTAVVTAINYRDNGMVTYAGHHVDERPETGQGAFRPEEVGTTPFGFCAVTKIGHITYPTPQWYPRPGDRDYDLMC